jgi:hypothetical protein
VKLVLAPQRGPFEDDLQLWFRYQPAAADHLLLRCVATGLVATADGAALPVRAKEQALPQASAGQLWRLLG